MAASKDVIEEAFPGDVIGLYDTGNFKIGDTLTEGEEMMFRGIPSFSPEIFKELINLDPMKTKQLDKGIEQLTDEGVAQLFIHNVGHKKVVGTVGELQFEVIQYRLENEYGAKCRFQNINMHKACWITIDDAKDPVQKKQLDEFLRLKGDYIYFDKDHNPVYMAETSWALNVARENNTHLTFHTTSEFKTEMV
jgi:peptide chain release factor 3